MSLLSKRLLVVLEESELGCTAARLAVDLASRLSASVSFLICIEPPHIEGGSADLLLATATGYEQELKARATPWFERAARMAQQAQVAAATHLILDQEPLTAIRDFADKNDCGLIVIGSHGHGTVMRAITGSIVKELIRTSPIPILVCREDMPGLRDGAPTSGGAVAGHEPEQG